MILLREVQAEDVPALQKLAGLPGFYNLPTEFAELEERVSLSVKSFSGKIRKKSDAKYMFVAVDLTNGQVVGTSMIAAQHGTAQSPHLFFNLKVEKRRAPEIQKKVIHTTLQLKAVKEGPSEIGGLVVAEEYRNSEERIGRQISFVRFLFLGVNKKRFKKKVIAELLPPTDAAGRFPLWEALGRKFTDMSYEEADRLSHEDKEFVLSLFPKEKIYTKTLPVEAQESIGKVADVTQAVYYMLTKIGFRYSYQVDPFDGGPHLWANVNRIVPIMNLRKLTYDPDADIASSNVLEEKGLICRVNQGRGEFRAMNAEVKLWDENLRFSNADRGQKICEALEVAQGDEIYFMPYY